jgi:DNA-binding transcriptional LysR family regulator
MQWLDPYDLPHALAAFHRANPGIDIRVEEESARDMLAAVLSDGMDAAFVPVDGELPAGLASHALFEDELVLIVAPDSRLAAKRALRMAALRDEPFVFLREGSGLRRVIETAARASGFEPHARFETNELARVVALVGQGLGVSVISRTVAEASGGVVRVVGLRPVLRRTVALVWRADRHQPPAARAFIDHVLAPASA